MRRYQSTTLTTAALRAGATLLLSVLWLRSYWRGYRVDSNTRSSIETVGLIVDTGSFHLWWTPAGGWRPRTRLAFDSSDPGHVVSEGERGALGFYYGRPKRYPYSWVRLPIALPWLICAAATSSALRRRWRHPHRPGLCPQCGYDLRATPRRCPECGARAGLPGKQDG